jgi:hypothetical protein
LPAYLQLAFPAMLSRKGGLSKRVVSQLRVGNQHKMGPSGIQSLLYEMHTLRFNTLQAQYYEAMFELTRGRQIAESDGSQPSLHSFIRQHFPAFGNFSDPQRYAGFVPSEYYLAQMMNKAIELEEAAADQHTACLGPDQIAIDDSHKINKHMAKIDGCPVFSALWTCMDSRYIRAQALTLTKAHEERVGPLMAVAKSIKLYGHDSPSIAFSDDPIKVCIIIIKMLCLSSLFIQDKQLLLGAFPNLSKGLTPMAIAHGLETLELPSTLKVEVLGTANLVEAAFSSLMAPLDNDPNHCICVSMDAEWNISRTVGVSIIQIAPHSDPDIVYIIPVWLSSHLCKVL